MTHYPDTYQHAADQFADGSRINSPAYREGYERVFGLRRNEAPEAEVQAEVSRINSQRGHVSRPNPGAILKP